MTIGKTLQGTAASKTKCRKAVSMTVNAVIIRAANAAVIMEYKYNCYPSRPVQQKS